MNTRQQLLRRRQVQALTGLGRATIYSRISQGEFPKPVKIGTRASRWVASEVEQWIANAISNSRPNPITPASQ